MANKPNLTPDELRQLLTYDPETGLFTWKPRGAQHFPDAAKMDISERIQKWNSRHAGGSAFTLDKSLGYHSTSIFGRKWYAHRAAWAIYHGEIPDRQVDHINGNKADNRIENLRLAYRHENQHNRSSVRTKLGKPTSSRWCGVSFYRRKGKWKAGIRSFGAETGSVEHHLGYFKCETAAAIAYNTAARRLHGSFARLN